MNPSLNVNILIKEGGNKESEERESFLIFLPLSLFSKETESETTLGLQSGGLVLFHWIHVSWGKSERPCNW